jgi:membrane peptidoglycan carboxypeptidase
MGDNVRAALRVAEVKDDGPGVLAETYRGFSDQNRPNRVTLSLHISRTMFCEPARSLNRQLNELRAAVQLERHFSRRELFTILANRLIFGEDLVGIEVASQHFFHREPNQLLVGEAALLAGLVKAPSFLSPTKHPDRALQRRNEVIDAMVQTHAISQSDASTAKASPLPVLSN